MTYATKREALTAVNAARTKAQTASEALRVATDDIPRHLSPSSAGSVSYDVARLHYDRCIRELEEAINDAAPFETSGDDE